MSTCRSCGSEIDWVRLNDKPHPVNSAIHKRIAKTSITRDGTVVAKMVDTYVSHFATCRQADQREERT